MDLAVFTNIVQYAFHKTKASRQGMTVGAKWGPLLCIVLATLLVSVDLVRHLVNDAWGTACSELDTDGNPNARIALIYPGQEPQIQPSKYTKYCYSRNVANEFDDDGAFGLSAWGWFATIFCTWTGYLLLFVGIFWVINFPAKFRRQWHRLRGARTDRRTAAGPLLQPSA